MEYEKIETGYSPEPQLYDMTKVYEEGNKALQHPEIVFQLQGILKEFGITLSRLNNGKKKLH